MKKTLAHTMLIIIGIIFLFPFIWLISTSLKSFEGASSLSLVLIPEKIRWENYVEVFKKVTFLKYLVNTLFLATIGIIGQMLTGSMVAYSLSHIEWSGKKKLFPIIVSTMLLPYQVTMIPVYIIFNKLHLLGSYWPLIIPYFLANAVNIFLLRQFFMTIPGSLIKAAYIDGANHYKIYTRIILPLSKPALAAVSVFTFINIWSDFIGPLIYLNKNEMFTISLGLKSFIGEHSVQWNLIMAASVVTTIPIIIIFFLAQKQFIEGITLTGIKG